jgi:hypothetical protein
LSCQLAGNPRIIEIPGLGLGVTLFHGAGSLFGLPCAHT